MFKHILIAYDGSAHSQRALERGLDLAQLTQAEVTLVTVFGRVPDYLGYPQYDVLVAHLTLEAQQTAARAAEYAKTRGFDHARVEVLDGPVTETILRVADTRGCDCVVLGSHGRGDVVGLLLGSVSDRVAHYAKVPVLIIK